MERTTARLLVTEERNKQIKKGFTPDHDNGHDDGFLVRAGTAIADTVACDIEGVDFDWPPFNWPEHWQGANAIEMLAKSQIERLVIAAALLEAEIDRQLYATGVGGAVLRTIHDSSACWLGQIRDGVAGDGLTADGTRPYCTGGEFCEKVLD